MQRDYRDRIRTEDSERTIPSFIDGKRATDTRDEQSNEGKVGSAGVSAIENSICSTQ